jgi:hypothetical protein
MLMRLIAQGILGPFVVRVRDGVLICGPRILRRRFRVGDIEWMAEEDLTARRHGRKGPKGVGSGGWIIRLGSGVRLRLYRGGEIIVPTDSPEALAQALGMELRPPIDFVDPPATVGGLLRFVRRRNSIVYTYVEMHSPWIPGVLILPWLLIEVIAHEGGTRSGFSSMLGPQIGGYMEIATGIAVFAGSLLVLQSGKYSVCVGGGFLEVRKGSEPQRVEIEKVISVSYEEITREMLRGWQCDPYKGAFRTICRPGKGARIRIAGRKFDLVISTDHPAALARALGKELIRADAAEEIGAKA